MTATKESQDESEGAVDDSQPVCECEVELEEEVVIEEDGVILDEGNQSILDCTTCKKSLARMEESYKQQITAFELELTHQQNCIDKYYYIKNELTNDEENFYKGKRKSGKGYVKKGYDLKQHALKKQYLRKIRSNEVDFCNWTIKHN